MGVGPCTGEYAKRVFISELRFDKQGRLELTAPTESPGPGCDDEPASDSNALRTLYERLHRHFISNDMPVVERRPRHILPFAASITKEVMIPRMWFHDPQYCRRMYVVNFRDGTQTIFLLEGFGESYDCRQHTSLQDLWDIVRANPSFLRELVSVQ